MPNRDITEGRRQRLTLDLSEKMNSEVERLAAQYGTTKADILRFAVDILTAAQHAKSEGLNVGAWTEKDGTRTERFFTGL